MRMIAAQLPRPAVLDSIGVTHSYMAAALSDPRLRLPIFALGTLEWAAILLAVAVWLWPVLFPVVVILSLYGASLARAAIAAREYRRSPDFIAARAFRWALARGAMSGRPPSVLP